MSHQIPAFTIGIIVTFLFLTYPSYQEVGIWLFNRFSDIAVQVLSHEITRRIA